MKDELSKAEHKELVALMKRAQESVRLKSYWTLQGVLRRILEMLDDGSAPAPEAKRQGAASGPARSAKQSLPASDEAAAKIVMAAAYAAPPKMRFGDNKVFICHVEETLRREGFDIAKPDDLHMSPFRQRLWKLHQARLVALSRADLVEAMPPELVDASQMEIRFDPGQYRPSAEYHFIRLGGENRR